MQTSCLKALAALGVLMAAASALGQTATYHLHNEASTINTSLKKLLTAGPDATATTAATVALKGKAAGEYVIKEFETQASIPNSPGTIPSGSTLSFTIWMRKTANVGTLVPRAKIQLNSATGTLFCTATGSTALTTTVTSQTFTCATTVDISMAATDRFYLWLGVNLTAGNSSTAFTGELDLEGTLNGNFDSQITVPLGTGVPTISALTPSAGAINSSVVITGTNFRSTQLSGSMVKFNGTATVPSVWTSTSITAPIPSGVPTGSVPATVIVGGQTSAAVNFAVTPTPSISSLAPNAGAVGSSITISGANFNTQGAGSQVKFGGTAATIINWTTSSITVNVPAGAISGNVVVTDAGGVQTSGVPFTVTPAPSITGLSPNSGAIGSSVTIAGSNFNAQGAGSTVTFGGIPAATISNWSSNSITVNVPSGAVSGNIVVTDAGGVTSNGMNFIVVVTPTITSLTPSSGEPGASVSIAGSNFTASVGTVTFNGLPASTTSWTNTNITAVIPNAATSGNVVVTSGGLQSNGAAFTVLVPTISNTAPTSGVAGTIVTLTGSNFGGSAGTVTFGGQSATINSWADGSIQAVVPASASTGNIVVGHSGLQSNGVLFTVAGQTFSGPVSYSYDELGRLVGAVANSGDAIGYSYDAVGNILSLTRYAAGQSTIFEFHPKSGPIGTSVSISGSNFSANPAQDTVSFNGTPAVVNSASTTSLAVAVPSGATTGTITVTSPSGSVTSSDSFTVTNSDGKPRIDSFTPQIAAPGTIVTIAGANFDTTPTNDRLIVNVTRGLNPTSASATSMSMNSPSATGSGRISLNTPTGLVTSSADLFIPTSGYSASQVAFTGRTNFGSTTTVSIASSGGLGLLIFDGVAGHSVSLSTSAPAFNGACTLQLYNPDYTPLGSSASCSSATFVDSQKLPTTGTYTVLITPSSGVTGSVAVTVRDSTDFVTSVVPNGAGVTLNINSAGQNARATFPGMAGQQATVQFTNNTLGSVTASLLNPDGSTLTSITSSSASFNLSTVMLPSTGEYTVLVDAASANTGSVVLSVAVVGGSHAVPARASGSVVDASNALSQNLVGLFVMNEANGTTDKNLTDNQVANFSGTTLPAWNTFDPSINFQGGASLASYLDAGTDLNFDRLTPDKMTVVAKVFLNSVTTGGIAEKNNPSASAGFAFTVDSTGALVLNIVKIANMRAATAANTVNSGQWMQVAFTWDGTVNTAAAAHIYVNGVEQTKVSSVDGTPGTVLYTGATNSPFRIGNASYDFSTTGSLNGKIAYLAVYRGRILTTAELGTLDSQLPIDVVDVSGTITPDGSALPITISSVGQNARFFFSAAGGQNATVQLSNNTLGSVTASLLNGDGTTLSTTTSSSASFTLPPSLIPVNGTYSIYVHPNGASSGTISVAVNLINTPSRPAGAVLDTSNPLSTNLTGLFVMNEGSGTTDLNLVDAQTAAFSGTSVPTWNTADPSVLFSGGGSLNSYLNAGTDLAFDQLPTSKVTILAKVYVNTVAAAGICEKNDVNQLAGFLFGWDSTGAIHLEVEESQTNMHVISGSSLVTSGQWIQVAFTWDGTINATSAAHLFLNGVEQNKVSSTSPGGTLTYANATNKPFRIGNAGFHAIAGSLNGKMAYLAVYRGRILTTAEMSQLDAQLPVH